MMKCPLLIKCVYLPALAVLLFAGFSPDCQAAAPHAVLIEIGEAMDKRDSATFQKLVDVDAILQNGLNVFLEEAKKPENMSQMPPLLALMLTQAFNSGGDSVRKVFLQEVKAFVLNGIQSGAFGGEKLDKAQLQGLLAPLLANASLGRKEIRGIGDTVLVGEDCLVPFSLHDYGNDQDYAIIGRFSPVDNSWRLTNIENFDQIFKQIQKEAASQQ